MTDTIESPAATETDTDTEPSNEQLIEHLKSEITELESKNESLHDELASTRSERDKYQQRVERLGRENEKLKQSPLFIGTIQDLLDDNKVVVKQHGNNQEVVTEVTRERFTSLNPQDRVALDNSLNIVKPLSDEVSSQAQVMQVKENPDVSYSDIGGLESQLQEVRETVEQPLTNPEVFDSIGIDPPSGILLHGPPGTGKTMIAKAVANQTDASFIQLSGSDLTKKLIGEGSRLVRDLFEVAREEEPAVIFIDEIDAIGAKRTDSKTSGDAEVQRTLMQLLNEMDGFDERGNVSVIAATNRVDMLDDAIMRPGRFDRHIEVAEPDVDGREQIFTIHTRDMQLADDVQIEDLAAIPDDDMTGAEIKAVCTEAGMYAIRNDRTVITTGDFEAAYEKIQQSDDDDGMGTTGPTLAFA